MKLNREIVRQRFIETISELEKEILRAKTIIGRSEFSEQFLPIIESHFDIVQTQKKYIPLLDDALENEDFDEVTRICKIIIQLSLLVKSDALKIKDAIYTGRPIPIEEKIIN